MNRRGFLKAAGCLPVIAAIPSVLFSQPINNKTLLIVDSPFGYAVFEFKNGLPDNWEADVATIKNFWATGQSSLPIL